MNIQKIKLYNFKIYAGDQQLTFDYKSQSHRNVFVVAGSNGYGKTTLLTSLVWCLYGKLMQEVDDIFKRQIIEAGGYHKYLLASMNRLAYANDERLYSVQITFNDIDIPGVSCSNIDIIRSYSYGAVEDKLQILIDGQENELIKDIGTEIFIHDFILPKEIAKFFFFDAEKIVSLAEMKSIDDKRKLSKAYSEVLGINKYETLKSNLQDLRLRFRRDSASDDEKQKFETTAKQIEEAEKLIEYNDEQVIKLKEEKLISQTQIDQIQERLIRQGSGLSVDQIKDLRKRKAQLKGEGEQIKNEFKDLMELAPFAISFKLLNEVLEQGVKELKQSKASVQDSATQDNFKKLLKDFKSLKNKDIHKATHEYYLKSLQQLIDKHFKPDEQQATDEVKVLHGFSEDELYTLRAIIDNLKTSYKKQLQALKQRVKRNRQDVAQVTGQLSDAESKEKDVLIQKHRDEKNLLEQRVIEIEDKIEALISESSKRESTLNSQKSLYESLTRKIEVGEKYKGKDKQTAKLIEHLNAFIVKMKHKKHESLEQHILQGLRTLMHKKDFVERVKVELDNDIIDIHLYNNRGEEIEKTTLSKGEQQLYATAILKSLVEESNIDFPVFIDSPMQKLDVAHSQNIIAEFYPTISKQVVILPLLNKEMTETEYNLLKEHINNTHLIVNEDDEKSSFMPVKPNKLFETAQKLVTQNV
ncbi:DNA sulfur modification protein DndD [Microscilla marina]|uniref:Rad50/SbcC-type AAA domain-containing protein n=1 Tax=Microscilla marina ATCC 23134 TaxID=313606 RepID=A1ZY55_MICM2|nr:DNA sulfur modification protein DndD [Microscilla marina]EAY24707.1 conserved hypothetical protein [Microscilla marina ATCC 23134]